MRVSIKIQKINHKIKKRKKNTSNGTTAEVSQPETCNEQTQPKATDAEQPRAQHHWHHGGPRNDNNNTTSATSFGQFLLWPGVIMKIMNYDYKCIFFFEKKFILIFIVITTIM